MQDQRPGCSSEAPEEVRPSVSSLLLSSPIFAGVAEVSSLYIYIYIIYQSLLSLSLLFNAVVIARL